jgi:hypothetical protein
MCRRFGTLFHLHSWCYITYEDKIKFKTPPLKMEQSSEMSAHKIQTPGITQKKEYNPFIQVSHVHEDDTQKAGSFFRKCICYMF